METAVIINILWLFTIITCTHANDYNDTFIDGGFIKTCPRPLTPENALISSVTAPRKSSDESSYGDHGVTDYQEHDRIYFQCKIGYSQVELTSVMYSTCGSNGKWFPPTEKSGKCIENGRISRCDNGLFRCRKSHQCIDQRKLCNCETDCYDGSDEENCIERKKYIMASSRGQDSNGVITSPGYPIAYPRNFTCIYFIQTMRRHHIEIFFGEFDLPKPINGICKDNVRLNGLRPKYSTLRPMVDDKMCSDSLYFKSIYSNKTRIAIKVELGFLNQKTYLRGFSLTWRVRSRKYVHDRIFGRNNKENLFPENQISKSDSIQTIITPIAITALLPLFLILFLCCHKKIKRQCKPDEKAASNSSATEDTLDDAEYLPMILTENNLLHHELEFSRNSRTDTHILFRNIPTGIESDSRDKREIRQAPQPCEFSKQLLNANNRNSYISEPSVEEMRYVRSYDMPIVLRSKERVDQLVFNQTTPTNSNSSSRSRICKCKRNLQSKNNNSPCHRLSSGSSGKKLPNRQMPIGREYSDYLKPPNKHLNNLPETNLNNYDIDDINNEYRENVHLSEDFNDYVLNLSKKSNLYPSDYRVTNDKENNNKNSPMYSERQLLTYKKFSRTNFTHSHRAVHGGRLCTT